LNRRFFFINWRSSLLDWGFSFSNRRLHASLSFEAFNNFL
jgi:hypothetical protein